MHVFYHGPYITVNCGTPKAPVNGSIGNYSHTREGHTINFWCKDGFQPSYKMTSLCTNDGVWIPEPVLTTCTFVVGKLCLS